MPAMDQYRLEVPAEGNTGPRAFTVKVRYRKSSNLWIVSAHGTGTGYVTKGYATLTAEEAVRLWAWSEVTQLPCNVTRI